MKFIVFFPVLLVFFTDISVAIASSNLVRELLKLEFYNGKKEWRNGLSVLVYINNFLGILRKIVHCWLQV